MSTYETSLDEAVNEAIQDFAEDTPIKEGYDPDGQESTDTGTEEEEAVEEEEDLHPDGEEGEEGEEEEEEEPSEDDEEEEEGEEEEEETDEEVELDDDLEVTLPNGETATIKELAEGHLRHKDYTQKTQKLAEERKEFEAERDEIQTTLDNVKQWYETRASQPEAWINEIADATGDSMKAFVDAVALTDDPSSTVANVLHQLARQGKLDKELVEHFGLQKVDGVVANRSVKAQENSEVARLRQELEELKGGQQTATAAQQAAAIKAEYEKQWTEVTGDEPFADDSAAREAVMVFARDNRIPNLKLAYKAMKDDDVPALRRANDPAKEEARKVIKAKKKKAGAISKGNKQRSGGGGAKPKTKANIDVDDALREVFSDAGWDTSDLS